MDDNYVFYVNQLFFLHNLRYISIRNKFVLLHGWFGTFIMSCYAMRYFSINEFITIFREQFKIVNAISVIK